MLSAGRALHWAVLLHLAASQTNNPCVALSVPVSGQWGGDDGFWSTFNVQIGSPPQLVQLLPGTSYAAGTSTWTIIPQGCGPGNANLAACAQTRGGIFMVNQSSTYYLGGLPEDQSNNAFKLGTDVEDALGIYNVNGIYGFDTISLDTTTNGVVQLPNQIIAGIATNDWFLGSLGLSPFGTNFTTASNSSTGFKPSLMGTLRRQSLIPSYAWSYTAGARYKDPPVFGSLTLGGQNPSRYIPNELSIPMSNEDHRDLIVRLNSITLDTTGSSPILDQSIDVYIDSLISELWLPTDACEAIAKQFNLTYKVSQKRYFVSNDAYSLLSLQKPNFKFNIGSPFGDGPTVTITLPYAAFDLFLKPPKADGNTTQRWFPIRRAQNATQYTLGRTFLQEAYVTADYDRRNFSVSQALFPAVSASQSLIAIQPPGSKVKCAGATMIGEQGGSSGSLSGGTIAGIVVGIVASLLLAALIWWFMRRRRHSRAKHESQTSVNYDPCEKDEAHEFAAEGNRWEVDGKGTEAELPMHTNGLYELEQPLHTHELAHQEPDHRPAPG